MRVRAKRKTRRKLRSLRVSMLMVVSAGLLQACVGGVGTVALGDKDSTGRFDGVWQINVSQGPSVQHAAEWRLDCSNMEHSFSVLVQNGTMRVWMNGPDEEPATTYIASDGRFRLAAPTGPKSSSTSSSPMLSNPENTMILNGTLNPSSGKGWYVWGVKAFGNHGCSSRFTSENLGFPPEQVEI